MPGVLKRKTKDGKWRAWYKSHLPGSDGYRKTVKFTGTTSRRDTLALAHQHQLDEDRIAAGLAAAPNQPSTSRGFVETVQEYLAYGESQGGHGGRPWCPTHARNQRSKLAWWHEQIGFETLEDLMQGLRPVETALVRLRDRGRTNKTLRDYQESLHALCRWCVDRGYLPKDPLARLRKFDTTPQVSRRPLTPPEIVRILALAPLDRALLYEKSRCSRVCVPASLRTSGAGTSTPVAVGSGWKPNGPRTAGQDLSRFPATWLRNWQAPLTPIRF